MHRHPKGGEKVDNYILNGGDGNHGHRGALLSWTAETNVDPVVAVCKIANSRYVVNRKNEQRLHNSNTTQQRVDASEK